MSLAQDQALHEHPPIASVARRARRSQTMDASLDRRPSISRTAPVSLPELVIPPSSSFSTADTPPRLGKAASDTMVSELPLSTSPKPLARTVSTLKRVTGLEPSLAYQSPTTSWFSLPPLLQRSQSHSPSRTHGPTYNTCLKLHSDSTDAIQTLRFDQLAETGGLKRHPSFGSGASSRASTVPSPLSLSRNSSWSSQSYPPSAASSMNTNKSSVSSSEPERTSFSPTASSIRASSVRSPASIRSLSYSPISEEPFAANSKFARPYSRPAHTRGSSISAPAFSPQRLQRSPRMQRSQSYDSRVMNAPATSTLWDALPCHSSSPVAHKQSEGEHNRNTSPPNSDPYLWGSDSEEEEVPIVSLTAWSHA